MSQATTTFPPRREIKGSQGKPKLFHGFLRYQTQFHLRVTSVAINHQVLDDLFKVTLKTPFGDSCWPFIMFRIQCILIVRSNTSTCLSEALPSPSPPYKQNKCSPKFFCSTTYRQCDGKGTFSNVRVDWCTKFITHQLSDMGLSPEPVQSRQRAFPFADCHLSPWHWETNPWSFKGPCIHNYGFTNITTGR